MKPCHAVEIVTPKRVVLNGLWFGPKKPKQLFIFVHGLGSSLWGKIPLAEALAKKGAAVLMFNNRGHDRISSLRRADTRKHKTYEYAGGAMEVFSDCVDDIEGAVRFARKQGAKHIVLIGHSTGCQKSIYWAHKKKGRGVKGIVLLAPLSDYAVALRDHASGRLRRATTLARSLVRRGRKHELLPQSVWPFMDDAQRFLSLYTPDSIEELFTYAQQKKSPRIFRSVRTPLFAIFAEEDEYADRPAEKIEQWFKTHTKSKRFVSLVVPDVGHSFKRKEAAIARAIHKWIAGS